MSGISRVIGKISYGGVTTPSGFRASAANADVNGKNEDRNDCGLIVSDKPCVYAGVFTKNLLKGAPVVFNMNILNDKKSVMGLFVNSGNANSCTGEKGYENCIKISNEYTHLLGFENNSILVNSTGIMGEQLPMEKISEVTDVLVDGLADDNGLEFAKAILTTDTSVKETAVCIETKSGIVAIGGCCKGSGMVSPNLATMLCFLTTDAIIERELLQRVLEECTELTFNSVTIDGNMSTNDSVIILANGMSGVPIYEENYEEFKEGLLTVMDYFARQIVLDGEGATKLVTIEVINAATSKDALDCASKIANSSVVKSMFNGCDPNWGRLMSSAGASGAMFDPSKVDIFFDDLHLVRNGMIIDKSLEEDAKVIMKKLDFKVTIDLHAGNFSRKFYTCDLTCDYVKFNADSRT